MPHRRRPCFTSPGRLASAVVALCAAVPFASIASAQTTRPALAELDREMRELYAQIDAGTVRVLLPVMSTDDLPTDHPLNKWGPRLDREVRRELLRQFEREEAMRLEMERRGGAGTGGNALPATSSATRDPELEAAAVDPEDPTKVVLSGDRDVVEQVGIILDEMGHVLVPAYLDHERLGGRKLRVKFGADLIGAALIASDRPTHLSLLKLDRAVGTPLNVTPEKLEDGALVLLLAPTRPLIAVEAWTGGKGEHALVITRDGAVAANVRFGQILPGSALRELARQMIETGEVERATLGVMLGELPLGHPLRAQDPALGARPAVHVMDVLRDSAADHAGLRPGDVILAVGDEPATDLTSFAAAIALQRGPTELRVFRNGQEQTLVADLQPARSDR